MTARIGEGQFVSGDMSSIKWGNGPYFAHYEVDYDGQEDWDISAYTQMMSVPYSLYAKYLEGGADQDTTNEIQFITISNDTLILSGGGTVSLANYLDNTDDQVLSISNDTISLEDGGLVVLPPLPPEVDLDSTNEIQSVSISNDSLFISGSNAVSLTNYLDNTDDQVLSISNDTISLEDGGLVVLPPLPPEVDLDSTNEIQSVSISNDSLFISGSNAVSLTNYLDNTDDQVLSISNDTISLEDGGLVVLPPLPTEVDLDSTNELQTLTFSNDTLKLSNGGEVVIPSGQVWNDSNSNINTMKTVGIGITNPDTNASLDLGTKPFLPTRMTTEQMLDIENPTDGMMVFNTDKGCPYYFFDDTWWNGCGGGRNSGWGGSGGGSGGGGAGGENFPINPTFDLFIAEGGSSYAYEVITDDQDNIIAHIKSNGGDVQIGNSSLPSGFKGIVKISSESDSVLWSYSLGGNLWVHLLNAPNNHFYAISKADPATNFTVEKRDVNGSIIWQRVVQINSCNSGNDCNILKGVGGGTDRGTVVDDDGNLYIAFNRRSFFTFNGSQVNAWSSGGGSRRNPVILKIDSAGNLDWVQTLTLNCAGQNSNTNLEVRLAFDNNTDLLFASTVIDDYCSNFGLSNAGYILFSFNASDGSYNDRVSLINQAGSGSYPTDVLATEGKVVVFFDKNSTISTPFGSINKDEVVVISFDSSLVEQNRISITGVFNAGILSVGQHEADVDGNILMLLGQDYYGIASGAIKIESQYTNGLAGIYRANENLQISDGVGAEKLVQMRGVTTCSDGSVIVSGEVGQSQNNTIKVWFGGEERTVIGTKFFLWKLP